MSATHPWITPEYTARRLRTLRERSVGSRWQNKCGTRTYWVTMTIDGPKYEHRHIMEQILGRQLLTEEHVHHKNGDGLDNRAENLEVIEGAEHMRQHRLNGTRRPEWYDSLRKPPGQWSRNYKQCILCGSSKSPYSSKGRCAKCNQRRYNEQRRSNSKLSTGR